MDLLVCWDLCSPYLDRLNSQSTSVSVGILIAEPLSERWGLNPTIAISGSDSFGIEFDALRLRRFVQSNQNLSKAIEACLQVLNDLLRQFVRLGQIVEIGKALIL